MDPKFNEQCADQSIRDNEAICLTDTTAVVELKKEFRALDEREEELKRFAAHDLDARPELCDLRSRKAEIARQIFQPKTAEILKRHTK